MGGQTITVGTGSLTSATLNTNSSPVSQFVIGGSQNQPAATFTFVAGTQGGANITELGFTVTNSAITKVMVGGVTASVVSGKALATGLNLAVPVGNSGLDVPVTVNYAPTGIGGISDATSLLTLAHIKYTAGNTTITNGTNVAPWSDSVTGIMTGSNQAANTMYLAGTAPTVAITGSGNFLSTGTQIVGSVTVSANAAGKLTLTQLPLSFATSSGVTLGTTVNVLDHATGNVAGTNTCGVASTCNVTLTNYNSISTSRGL